MGEKDVGLLSKLASVQSELKVPKDMYNSFGKYKYRSAEGILEALKPLLKKNGLALKLSDEVVQIGSRFYVMATATVTDVETGLSTDVTAYAREDESKKGMDGSQISGTASSYARKYALNGLFLIDDSKDADTDEYHKQQSAATSKESRAVTAKERRLITLRNKWKSLNDRGMTSEQIGEQMKQYLGFSITKDMTQEQFDKANEWFDKMLED
jgi:hypothetical protein